MQINFKGILFIGFLILMINQELFSENISFEKIDSELIGLQSEDIISLALDNNNHLWVGARNRIIEYDNENWIDHSEIFEQIEFLYHPNKSEYNSIFGGNIYPIDIQVDNNNHIWISTSFGLIEYDHNNWKLNSVEKETPDCFLIDDNRVWMFSSDTLYLLKDGIWSEYFTIFNGDAKRAIPNTYIFKCYEIHFRMEPINDDYLLMATTWGLLKFDIKKRKLTNCSPSKQKQPFHNLTIQEEEENIYWLRTRKGIAKTEFRKFSVDWKFYPKSEIQFSDTDSDRGMIQEVYIAPNKDKWLITRITPFGRLYKFDEQYAELIFTLKEVSNKSKKHQINDLIITENNVFFIATSNGLYQSK